MFAYKNKAGLDNREKSFYKKSKYIIYKFLCLISKYSIV